MAWIVRGVQFLIPKLLSGPVPAIARGSFNMAMLGVGLLISGYFSNVDKSFQALSASVDKLNSKMSIVLERSDSQQTTQEMHSRILENMDKRLQKLEEQKKEIQK